LVDWTDVETGAARAPFCIKTELRVSKVEMDAMM
jgi:hypothetical protein